RAHAFATKYDIPIIEIIGRSDYRNAQRHDRIGKMINSSLLDGMEVMEAIRTFIQKLEETGIGRLKVNFKLRDANFSRQRYWREPIPIVYDKDGIPSPVDLDELPVLLPDTDDFKPAKDGRSPVAKLTDWVKYEGNKTRETDTM